MNKVIEIVERNEIEGNVYIIAECNGYENGVLIRQFSRSPFVFELPKTDEEIIQSLLENEYSKYF